MKFLVQKNRKHKKIVDYILISFGISWAFWIPLIWIKEVNFIFSVLHALGGFGPLIAAYFLFDPEVKKNRLKYYLISIFAIKAKIKDYLVVILTPLIILGIALLIRMLFFPNLLGEQRSFLMYPLFMIYMIFFGGGLEEPGWRGFMLKELLLRKGPLLSSLIVGIVWVIWHSPLYFISTLSLSQMPFLEFFINGLFLSMIMTHVYFYTSRNTWLMILLHAGYNTMFNFYPTPFHHEQAFIPLLLATMIIGSISSVILWMTHKKVKEEDSCTET